MYTICIVSPTEGPSPQLLRCVEDEGLNWFAEGSRSPALGVSPDAVLLDLTLPDEATLPGEAPVPDEAPVKELVRRGRALRGPLLAALGWAQLSGPPLSTVDDFVICPWRPGELEARLRWLLGRQRPEQDAPGLIRVGDLVINPERYDVFLDGKPVLLTFKEYELLKLLASNPSRVFKRDVLLSQVWGYDYFGGTRTVDVHIRRLRSKIEDGAHTFIETVWNVGYRFKA